MLDLDDIEYLFLLFFLTENSKLKHSYLSGNLLVVIFISLLQLLDINIGIL